MTGIVSNRQIAIFWQILVDRGIFTWIYPWAYLGICVLSSIDQLFGSVPLLTRLVTWTYLTCLLQFSFGTIGALVEIFTAVLTFYNCRRFIKHKLDPVTSFLSWLTFGNFPEMENNTERHCELTWERRMTNLKCFLILSS